MPGSCLNVMVTYNVVLGNAVHKGMVTGIIFPLQVANLN